MWTPFTQRRWRKQPATATQDGDLAASDFRAAAARCMHSRWPHRARCTGSRQKPALPLW
jgi:hypothetical protein